VFPRFIKKKWHGLNLGHLISHRARSPNDAVFWFSAGGGSGFGCQGVEVLDTETFSILQHVQRNDQLLA
jgi:hypothetical protein